MLCKVERIRNAHEGRIAPGLHEPECLVEAPDPEIGLGGYLVGHSVRPWSATAKWGRGIMGQRFLRRQ